MPHSPAFLLHVLQHLQRLAQVFLLARHQDIARQGIRQAVNGLKDILQTRSQFVVVHVGYALLPVSTVRQTGEEQSGEQDDGKDFLELHGGESG